MAIALRHGHVEVRARARCWSLAKHQRKLHLLISEPPEMVPVCRMSAPTKTRPSLEYETIIKVKKKQKACLQHGEAHVFQKHDLWLQ